MTSLSPVPTRHDVEALLARSTDVNAATPRKSGPTLDDVVADVQRLGLAPGTPVVIAMANSVDLLKQYFAALLAGHPPLLISPATPSGRIAGLASQVGAGALIGARPDPERYGSKRVWPVGAQAAVLLATESRPDRYPEGSVLMSTSGTSGMFSACLHRFGSLTRNAWRHARAVGCGSDDTLLVTLPLYFSYAIVAQAITALVTGAALVISGPPFSATAFGRGIEEHDVTSAAITPTVARQLLDLGKSLPPHLRSVSIGGDRIAPEHVGRLLRLIGDRELFLTYGLTEAGPRVATLAAHREPAHRHASVGVPLDGVSVSLRDTQPDGSGELLVHTDTALLRKVAAGDRDPLLEPGVVATGDRFTLHDGYLYFQGRLSDFVVIGGEKVSLHSVRQAAQSIPGVVRCVPRATTAPGDGDLRLELELHVVESASLDESTAARLLRPMLLRSEQPRSITVIPVTAASQHK